MGMVERKHKDFRLPPPLYAIAPQGTMRTNSRLSFCLISLSVAKRHKNRPEKRKRQGRSRRERGPGGEGGYFRGDGFRNHRGNDRKSVQHLSPGCFFGYFLVNTRKYRPPQGSRQTIRTARCINEKGIIVKRPLCRLSARHTDRALRENLPYFSTVWRMGWYTPMLANTVRPYRVVRLFVGYVVMETDRQTGIYGGYTSKRL